MQNAPAAERNKEAILTVLQEVIPVDRDGSVLEIAAGTGQHAVHFAKSFPKMIWQPSEYDSSLLSSISAYIQHTGVQNVRPPIQVDVRTPADTWNAGKLSPVSFDVVYNSNMVHISPWATAVGLFKACNYLLKAGGHLVTYGPYSIDGTITPDSNVQFDKSLKSRDPEWGLRDIQDMKKLAEENDMKFLTMTDMPANNKILVFQKNC